MGSADVTQEEDSYQRRLEQQFPDRAFRTDFYEDPKAEEVII